jgi:hypothetical protein
MRNFERHIDRLQKSKGYFWSYTPSDFVSAAFEGMEMINSVQPITSWDLQQLPWDNGFGHYLTCAAGIKLFTGQRIAHGEANFNTNLQDANIDVDRSQVYATEIAQWNGYLDANLRIAKREWCRHHKPVAVLGVRFGASISGSSSGGFQSTAAMGGIQSARPFRGFGGRR